VETELSGAGEIPSRRSISAQVLGLAWPVIVEQLLATAVGLTNTYIVSHLGAASLAAVGLSTQLSNLLIAMFSAVGVGSTALVARHIGAREQSKAEMLAGQSLLLAICVGLIAAVPCLLLGDPLFTMLGGDAEVVELGRGYLAAVATTMPLMAILLIGNAVLRGAGDTRTPMMVMGLVNLVNVGVSWSLVYGVGPLPSLGVLGAGIGAATGVGAGGLMIGVVLLGGRSVSDLVVRPAMLRFHAQRSRRLLRIGLPSGAEQALMRIAQLLLATVVTRLSTAAYAGHQLGIQMLSVAFMPGFAISVAVSTLVGQELGRRAPRRAEVGVRVASWIALVIMSGAGALVFVFAEPLLQLFTSEPDVLAQGMIALRGAALIEPPLAVYFVLVGALRGAGDTRFVLLAQVGSIWLIRLPLAFLLALTLNVGLAGVWTANIIDITIRATVLGLRFRSGAWQRVRV
jgi:putative MATE family efflux protein